MIENPAAYRFIIDEDIYLLKQDKIAAQPSVAIVPVVLPAAEPIIVAPAEQITTTAEAAPLPTPAIAFKYLGQHKKSFLILVHYAGHEFIAGEHLTALTNILKRLELDIDDVAILNIASHNAAFEEIAAHFKPQKILLMGENALPANTMALTLNQPAALNGGRLLYSFSFDEMMSSNDNKKAFWEQMKGL